MGTREIHQVQAKVCRTGQAGKARKVGRPGAANARNELKLRFTSLAHHITRERVRTNLCQIPKRLAPGVDGQTVTDAKETLGEWVEPVPRSVHRQGYRAPNIRRVYIPKPGKREKRPLGVPASTTGRSSAAPPRCCRTDRALRQASALTIRENEDLARSGAQLVTDFRFGTEFVSTLAGRMGLNAANRLRPELGEDHPQRADARQEWVA
jgi:hypothetical protein